MAPGPVESFDRFEGFDRFEEGLPKQLEVERMLVEQRLKGFNIYESEGFRFITSHFEGEPNRKELLTLARVCAKHLGIALDREATRRKGVLYKWFDENLPVIQNFIKNHITIEYKD